MTGTYNPKLSAEEQRARIATFKALDRKRTGRTSMTIAQMIQAALDGK